VKIRTLLAAAAVSAVAMPALAESDQWKSASRPSPVVTLHDLVKQGYEIKGVGPGRLVGSWIYLQKGTSVYRCTSDLPEDQPTCLELVAPFKKPS
jgi:hypothetical protein